VVEKKQDEINAPDKKEKFENYAYIVATFLFVLIWIAPSYLGLDMYEHRHRNPLIQPLMEIVGMIEAGYGIDTRNIAHWRPFSWMAFVLAAIVVAIKDLFDAKNKTDETRKILLRKAIYIVIVAALLFRGILTGSWNGTWMSGPVTWILFMLLWIFSGKPTKKGAWQTSKDLGLISIFVLGIIAEIWTQAWVAFPVSWIFISAIEVTGLIRKRNHTENNIYDILYHVFTIILISIGLIWNIWFTSWLALPIVAVLSKVISLGKSWFQPSP